MHDPMVVAFDVVAPWPDRQRYREAHYKGRRWGWTRRRRANEENRGEPVYPWWRLAGWTFAVAGRVFGLRTFATVWHVEPGGRDAFTVCAPKRWREVDEVPRWRVLLTPGLRYSTSEGKRWVVDRRWAWHVHHWHIQLPWAQSVRARLFNRCELCGRKGRPNVSHQWDGPGPRHWWQSRPGLYHRECSALISHRRTIETDEVLIRHLAAALRVVTDESEVEVVARLTDPHGRGLEFREAHRLTRVLGFERDDDYELVKRRDQVVAGG